MTTVLLFAEHELDGREVTMTLEALAGLRSDGERQVDVTVVVPYPAHWPAALTLDLAAARGLSASRTVADSRHDAVVVRASALQVLHHVLSAVRDGGHVARGELVAVRDAVRDLTAEAAARRATTALVVSSPHRVSHLLHRDLEHRLRHAGVDRVVRVRPAAGKAARTRTGVVKHST
jgi:hypothetical protein